MQEDLKQKNSSRGKGQYCLVIQEGTKKYRMPLFDSNDQITGELDYLSSIDDMTMRFPSQSRLLIHYKELKLLPPLKTQNYEVYIMSHKADLQFQKDKKERYRHPKEPNHLSVAYEKDKLLRAICNPGKNIIEKRNTYGIQLINAFLNDVWKVSTFYSDIIHPTTLQVNYFDVEMKQLIKEVVTRIDTNLPYGEQQELEYERNLNRKKLMERLENYKQLRGVYFAYQDFEQRYPKTDLQKKQLDRKILEEGNEVAWSKGDSYPDYEILDEESYDDPDYDPYSLKPRDPFDRPEVSLEPEDPFSDFENDFMSFSDPDEERAFHR